MATFWTPSSAPTRNDRPLVRLWQAWSTACTFRELVINYHMSEACNYRCEFCFATWETQRKRAELHRADGGVDALLDHFAGYFLDDNPLRRETGYSAVRINFAGGEPVLLGNRFQSAVRRAHGLGFTCSVITNGHFIDEAFVAEMAPLLSMVGVSYDSAEPETQRAIGRRDRRNRVLPPDRLLDLFGQMRKANPSAALKINTVVNRLNWEEEMNSFLDAAWPDKWKVLRVLPVLGDALTVADTQFKAFCQRHQGQGRRMIIEDNTSMSQSYLMINPEGRFYQNGQPRKGYATSAPILETGVAHALSQISFDPPRFAGRYGQDARNTGE